MLRPWETLRKSMRSVVLFLLIAVFGSVALRAQEVPSEFEPDYERAVVAFNSGQFDESIRLIDALLSRAPQLFAALELKALDQKAKKEDSAALKVYDQLIRTGPLDRKPKYYFEVASLLYRNKRYAQARIYFNASIRGQFNVGASHYFQGLIDYEDKQYEAAERHFAKTTESNADDLKPLAYFYLGVIYFKLGHSGGAIRGFRYAHELVEPWIESGDPDLKKAGEQISLTSVRMLKGLDRSRWFGNLTAMTQYDSNVTLLPDSIKGGQQATNKRTLKQIFTGGAGFMSSPARRFQVVAGYRTFFNWNFNSGAKQFDFFSHIPSVYVNYKPFNRLAPGVKIDGTYTFQNLAGAGQALEYHPYSLTGEMGPYARYEVTPHLFGELDVFMRPKKFYSDPTSGDDRRSGGGWYVRAQAEYASPWKLLIPTGFLSWEIDSTNGKNWSYSAFAFGASNMMRIDPKNTVVGGLDLSFPRYTQRSAQRSDTIFTLKASWVRALTKHFSLLVDLNFTRQSSNIESLFTYSRWFGGAGINYAF